MAEGVEGLTRDKTRKPGKRRFRPTAVQRVVDLRWDRRRGSNPLDRPDAGEGGGSEPAFGAAHP